MAREVSSLQFIERSLWWILAISAASDVSADDFVAATAIGSNAALGDHIREEAVEWYESALTALPQYAKIDIGKDDLETKRELLLQLSELYL